jgi:hypothetical protein
VNFSRIEEVFVITSAPQPGEGGRSAETKPGG